MVLSAMPADELGTSLLLAGVVLLCMQSWHGPSRSYIILPDVDIRRLKQEGLRRGRESSGGFCQVCSTERCWPVSQSKASGMTSVNTQDS